MSSKHSAASYWELFKADRPYWAKRASKYAEWHPYHESDKDAECTLCGFEWETRERQTLERLLTGLNETQLDEHTAEGVRQDVADATFEDCATHFTHVKDLNRTIGELQDENTRLRTALSWIPSAEQLEDFRLLGNDYTQAFGGMLAKLSAVRRNMPDGSRSPSRRDLEELCEDEPMSPE